ncbi:hypothetical protein A2614_01740 [Candidatus Woesebacteria bacterium RIFOXYD1_FULL_40_21]|uniref:Sodium/calcium exchanger membrane region domain-containing protein n=2 Tax=Candidatus Woeseibacteriota TaxID=1752722 RepID=A0A1F8DGR5_9BACT|nr:MAG: K+-dependent Na+/Ca+ exchanger related-protein [Candidatus Woesebacteria bacterium GW2011_GWB1_40_101]OGM86985.1 MAG: hypothetical protein A2614_01740 [Candidatus Woesebacteria bacterium RIFOXYD1_FULL_40_21]
MTTIFLIISIFILSFILMKSSEQVVIALRHLAAETHTKLFILSALIIAISTSFPELFVGITSALEGSSSLSLGNILGANVTNLSLVAGVSALVAGHVNVHGEFLKHEIWIAAIAGMLPIILVLDGDLDRIDGLILLLAYGAYATSFFKVRFMQIAEQIKKGVFFHRFLRSIHHVNTGQTKEMVRFFLGIFALLFSAGLIVKIAKDVAIAANIPLFLIGLIFLSIGTTLPELVFSFTSLKDKEPTMFFGNLLGSIIANSTLIIGVTVLISPIKLVAFSEYLVASIAFISIFFVFWLFTRSKLQLTRWEAAILLILYLIFVVVEFL